MHFGHAHAPVDLATNSPHLVSTPARAAPRWGSLAAHPIAPEAATRAARYLAGDPEVEALGTFLAELPDLADLAQVGLADLCLSWLDALDGHGDADALPAARLLNQVAPRPGALAERKLRLLNALVKQLRRGDAVETLRFANYEVAALAGASDRLIAALREWSDTHIADSGNDDVVFRALEGTNKEWWQETVKESVAQFVRTGNALAAYRLWQWWSKRPDLLDAFIPWLDHQADAALFASMPTPLNARVAQRLIRVMPQEFVQLTAATRVALYPPQEAISLAITESPRPGEALRATRERLGNEAFVLTAVALDRNEGLSEAGAAVKLQPTILMHLNPGDAAWRRVWYEAIKLGVPPLTATSNPTEVVTATFSALLEGEVVPDDLFAALANTPFSNLLGLPQRAAVWCRLPVQWQSDFLAATAQALLISQSSELGGIEDELAQTALEPSLLSQVVQANPSHRADVLRTYIALLVMKGGNELQSAAVITQLHNHAVTLTVPAVTTFANHVQIHGLKSVALAALDALTATNHPTMAHIVEQTYSMLPALMRLRAQIALHKPVKEHDIHAALVPVLARYFPRGPADEGIWEDAGGDTTQIERHGSADSMWRSALREVGTGRVPLEDVMRVARTRYPHSPELAELERLSPKLHK